jgi:hypothetical protein
MKKELANHKWGGSGIEIELFQFIIDEFKEGSTIVELGSGYCSTKAFSLYFNTYSIDENPDYLHIFNYVNYLHAPKRDGWYDRELVKEFLPEKYSLVFVDGPLGEGNRNGLISNIDIFDKDSSFIFHDTFRDPEKKLALEVARILNRDVIFYEKNDFWGYIK